MRQSGPLACVGVVAALLFFGGAHTSKKRVGGVRTQNEMARDYMISGNLTHNMQYEFNTK